MKRAHWAMAAIVAGIEVWVLSLAPSPQVSADYRAYYLERSTDCWPLGVGGQYRLGQTLIFRDGDAGLAAGPFKQCGWIPAFEAGSWTQGDRARLRFDFAVPQGGLVIALLAQGYVGAARLSQRVEVSVNGVRLDDVTLTPQSAELVVIPVDAEVVALDPDGLTLQFDFPDRISPRAMGISDDDRELGLLVREMMIVAAPEQ